MPQLFAQRALRCVVLVLREPLGHAFSLESPRPQRALFLACVGDGSWGSLFRIKAFMPQLFAQQAPRRGVLVLLEPLGHALSLEPPHCPQRARFLACALVV